MRSHGLRVTPFAALAVHGQIVSSGTLVIPIGIAPAARSRRTASASAGSGGPWLREPFVSDCPATARSSLIAIGTPDERELCPGRFHRLTLTQRGVQIHPWGG